MDKIIEKTPVKFSDWGKSTALRIPSTIANSFHASNDKPYSLTLIKKKNGQLRMVIEEENEEVNRFLSDEKFLSSFDSIAEKYEKTLKDLVDM